MSEKLADPKTIEKLALLIVAKTGPDDNVSLVANKVIADYFEAKKAIKVYNDSIATLKLELLNHKKLQKKIANNDKTKADQTNITKGARQSKQSKQHKQV